MSQRVVVTNREYRYQGPNGDNFLINPGNFSNFYSGVVDEKVQAKFEIEVSWSLQIVDFKRVNQGGGVVKIIKEGAQFDQIFSIGDQIIETDSGGNNETGEIIFLSADELILENYSNPSVPSDDNDSTPNWFKGNTDLTALNFSYGFPENEDPFTNISRYTRVNQSFFVSEIDNTLKELTPRGNLRGHVTGPIQCRFIERRRDDDLSTTTLTVQAFEVIQEFIIVPGYEDGQLANLESITNPEPYVGEASPKHVIGSDWRRTLNNPNTSKSGEDEGFLGSIGWYGENFNQLPNNYTIGNVSVQVGGQEVENIDIGETTTISFTVTTPNDTFEIGQPVTLIHKKLPSVEEYQNSRDDFQTTWIFDGFRFLIGDSGVNGNIFQNVSIVLDNPGQITVTADLVYSIDQLNRIELGDNYLISCITGTNPPNLNDSDKVNNPVKVGQYFRNTDVPGLFDVTSWKIYSHSVDNIGIAGGFTDYKGWGQDGVFNFINFKSSVLNNAVIETLNFKQVAYNESENVFFVIQDIPISLQNQVVQSGKQLITLDTTRGFKLAEGDQFNDLKLETTDFFNISGEQNYELSIGNKIQWQTSIPVPTADTIFFNASQENNGLNRKSANYSDVNGYKIHFLLEAQVSQDGLITIYREFSPEIVVKEFDEDGNDPARWSCEILTEDQDGNDLLGNVSSDEFTTVTAVFTPNGFVPILGDYYGILRIEASGQTGEAIDELSTIREVPSNNVLVPLPGLNQCQIQIGLMNEIILTGRVDPSRLEAEVTYDISAKIGTAEAAIVPGSYSDGYDIDNAYD